MEASIAKYRCLGVEIVLNDYCIAVVDAQILPNVGVRSRVTRGLLYLLYNNNRDPSDISASTSVINPLLTQRHNAYLI